jgi:hypothetical protein
VDPVRELGRQSAPTVQQPQIFRHFGVVQSSTAGPPASVTVTLSGSSTSTAGIRYLASYTPTNGDTVLILRAGGDLVCIGKLA